MTPAHDEPLEEQAARAPTNSGYARNGTLFPQVYRAAAPPFASKKFTLHGFFSAERDEWVQVTFDSGAFNEEARGDLRERILKGTAAKKVAKQEAKELKDSGGGVDGGAAKPKKKRSKMAASESEQNGDLS